MTGQVSQTSCNSFHIARSIRRVLQVSVLFLLSGVISSTSAQEVRYSWLDIAFLAQDVDRMGVQFTPSPGQTVRLHAKDGSGIRFRGSVGTWRNIYLFVDYTSVDIDVDVVVRNMSGDFPASDEFDLTSVRAGMGVRIPVRFNIDLYGELSYDSTGFDFGSFAGEDFDTDNQDVGGALGVRAMLNDDIELRAYGRYTNQGDVDLTTGVFDTDTVFGVGFGWQLVRGLSIIGDYESGNFSRWAIGFRLDLDED